MSGIRAVTELLPKRTKLPAKLLSSIPSDVRAACEKLSEGGFMAWLAGGCVRDMLLGREPRDWDVVTEAAIEDVQKLFPRHLDVGVAFGVLKLPPLKKAGHDVEIDIAIFRKEEGYSDRRHPDKVERSTPAHDAARRDFTINAMFLDMETGEIVDFFNGQKDLAAKVIRCVGTPETRFSEDALRILRAVRFSGQLGFKIDRSTAAAAKKCAALLKDISRERIREEIFRLLRSSKPVAALEYLAQLGLWEHVFSVKRSSLPADYRNIKVMGTPEPLDWVAGLGVCGLLGDVCNEPREISARLADLLRLSRAESRTLDLAFDIYQDAAKSAANDRPSPERWVEAARDRKELLEFLKSFVRRARGPDETQKKQALHLLEQSLRWARSPNGTQAWPTAQSLLKEGHTQGAKLGKALAQKQWEAFWMRPQSETP